MLQRRLSVAILCFTLPISACANAGTPLMWAGLLHLAFGNALIGHGEGLFLARLFRGEKSYWSWLMVGANYFSAWVGAILLAQFSEHKAVDLHLYNAASAMWLLIGVSFVLTLILEWPFIAFGLRNQPQWCRKSLLANLRTQVLSYSVLILWYGLASQISLFTQVKTVPISAIPTIDRAKLFFISGEDGDVYSINLNGSQKNKICDLSSAYKQDRLAVEKLEDGSWRLVSSGGLVLATNWNGRVAEDWRKSSAGFIPDSNNNFGPVANLGDTNGWKFSSGFWAGTGLFGKNKNTGDEIQVALETPFLVWRVRNGTKLPNEQVVFQFGQDQICLFDPETKRVALITRGRGPVVVLDP